MTARPRTRPTAAWLDAQYNNRARIPEHPAIFQRWSESSARARRRLEARLDLAYGPTPGQRLDVFPAPLPGAPVVVFIHGGYWRSLDKREQSFVAPAFVQQGACVVVPNHDLCPGVTLETVVLQQVAALAWVWRHIAEHGGDPTRLVVVGHSAGAHLAAMMLACQWPRVAADLPPHLVRTAVGLSGLYDLEPLRRTPYLQGDLRLTPAMVDRASPARLPPPQGRFFCLVGGAESEQYHWQSQRLQRAWSRAVVPSCEALPGVHHLAILDHLADPDGRAHGLVQELLAQAQA